MEPNSASCRSRRERKSHGGDRPERLKKQLRESGRGTVFKRDTLIYSGKGEHPKGWSGEGSAHGGLNGGGEKNATLPGFKKECCLENLWGKNPRKKKHLRLVALTKAVQRGNRQKISGEGKERKIVKGICCRKGL